MKKRSPFASRNGQIMKEMGTRGDQGGKEGANDDSPVNDISRQKNEAGSGQRGGTTTTKAR
jgi:hypothetical protein